MRTLKFIQVNIFMGTYLDDLINFLKKEKPDFISMQEVSYGNLNKTGTPKQNLFKILKEELGLNGVCNFDLKTFGPNAGGMGNAILTKHEILKTKLIILNKIQTWKKEDLYNPNTAPNLPRHILDCVVDFYGSRIHIMSIHGAWTQMPVDTQEKIRQANLIAKYLKFLREPYILGGDFNMPPGTKTIEIIDKVSNNLMKNSGIEFTTHPKIHKIVPRRLLVDCVYTSKNFKPISIKAPVIIVSDHLPIVARLQLL